MDKEALAIIFGVKKFHTYLFGRKFMLVTDHKPLLTILGQHSPVPTLAAARLQRWAIILSAYQYDLQFRKTEQHGNADALSRFPIPDETSEEEGDINLNYVNQFLEHIPLNEKTIAKETAKDAVLSKVIEGLRQGWSAVSMLPEIQAFEKKKLELTLERGVLLWGRRVVVPKNLQPAVLKLLHEQHCGIERMKGIARSYVWGAGLDEELSYVTKKREICARHQNAPSSVSKDAQWPIPVEAWTRLHIDYADYQGTRLLVVTDATSKWPEVLVAKDTTATTTVDLLTAVFATDGLPVQVVSDNGPQFATREFFQVRS